LPGVDLIDVRLWQSMIDEVVAFEPLGPDDNPRGAIDLLRKNMKRFGIKGMAYWGSFEQVVMLRKDIEGQPYDQVKLITLYNLDFCDEITSKIETQEGGKQVLRFEAIRQILRDQATCFEKEKEPRHFILLLTIRNQSSSRKLHRLLSSRTLLADAKAHHVRCSTSNPIPFGSDDPLIGSHSWALKTVVFNYLLSYFNNPCLSALFFPTVLYNGTPVTIPGNGARKTLPSPMLHCVVLCRFAEPEQPAADCWPLGYLTRSSVAVGAGMSLIWSPQTGEVDGDPQAPDSVRWLKAHGAEVLKDL
jgi:hypothetical protein